MMSHMMAGLVGMLMSFNNMATPVGHLRIVEWRSVATHQNGLMEIGLVMGYDSVEPRRIGLSKIQVAFTEPIDPSSLDRDTVSVIGDRSGDVSYRVMGENFNPAGDVMNIFLAAPGDVDRYTFSVKHLRSLDGRPLNGPNHCRMISLKGDANRSHVVDIGDVMKVQANGGKAVTLSTAQCDVNQDGRINIGDITMVHTNQGHRVP